jgi:glycerophosphoryl diester phosphodiesterase
MDPTRRQFAASAAALALAPAGTALAQARVAPIVIARGGADGGWPAQSAGAYAKAIEEGADFLEAGLVSSKDGHLVVRQDDELSASTDVAARPDFAERRATRVIGGETREGWFAEDFTLAELKSLNLPLPPHQRRPDGATRPVILTLEEVIALARAGSVSQARVVGIYADLLHADYFTELGLPLEPRLADLIRVQGYESPAAAMFVASEQLAALASVAQLVRTRRVLRTPGAAALTPDALRALASRVFAIAPQADQALDLANPHAPTPSGLVQAAHDAGLRVHVWAGGAGRPFPPPPFRGGDERRLLTDLFAAGADGVCADLASPAVRARGDATSRKT